jgi:hypothetical protein
MGERRDWVGVGVAVVGIGAEISLQVWPVGEWLVAARVAALAAIVVGLIVIARGSALATRRANRRIARGPVDRTPEGSLRVVSTMGIQLPGQEKSIFSAGRLPPRSSRGSLPIRISAGTIEGASDNRLPPPSWLWTIRDATLLSDAPLVVEMYLTLTAPGGQVRHLEPQGGRVVTLARHQPVMREFRFVEIGLGVADETQHYFRAGIVLSLREVGTKRIREVTYGFRSNPRTRRFFLRRLRWPGSGAAPL